MRVLLALTLLATPRIGRRTARQVLERLTEPTLDLDVLRVQLEAAKAAVPRLRVPTREELEGAREAADRIVADAERLGLTILGPEDTAFPSRLRVIPDAPLLLFAKGDLAALGDAPAVAVVGTREPTARGLKGAERLGCVFAERGLVVVSGLALGCDAAGHRGALQAGGRTVAILAHGLHTVTPSQHRGLAEEIVAGGGCLLSEYAPGVAAERGHFVERDRLQSGMSAGTVVVETGLKGGTMHTVGFCLEQGRRLACLAPAESDDSRQTEGVRHLLQEGKAVPLGRSEDIEAFVRGLREAPAPIPAAAVQPPGGAGQLSLFQP